MVVVVRTSEATPVPRTGQTAAAPAGAAVAVAVAVAVAREVVGARCMDLEIYIRLARRAGGCRAHQREKPGRRGSSSRYMSSPCYSSTLNPKEQAQVPKTITYIA